MNLEEIEIIQAEVDGILESTDWNSVIAKVPYFLVKQIQIHGELTRTKIRIESLLKKVKEHQKKTCGICEGKGVFDKPLDDSQVEFDATCECQK